MSSIMLPPVINILKPHPIGSKPNLQNICHATNIHFETTETRSQLSAKIANFADKSLPNEATIRGLVNEINAEVKKNKTQIVSMLSDCSGETMELDPSQDFQPTMEPNQDSQTPLFDDTQDTNEVSTETTAVTIPTEATEPTPTAPLETVASNLKRRLQNPEAEDDDFMPKKSKSNETTDKVLIDMVLDMNAENIETRKQMTLISASFEELKKLFEQVTSELHECNLNIKSVCEESRNQHSQVSEAVEMVERGM